MSMKPLYLCSNIISGLWIPMTPLEAVVKFYVLIREQSGFHLPQCLRSFRNSQQAETFRQTPELEQGKVLKIVKTPIETSVSVAKLSLMEDLSDSMKKSLVQHNIAPFKCKIFYSQVLNNHSGVLVTFLFLKKGAMK